MLSFYVQLTARGFALIAGLAGNILIFNALLNFWPALSKAVGGPFGALFLGAYAIVGSGLLKAFPHFGGRSLVVRSFHTLELPGRRRNGQRATADRPKGKQG